ncbi:MAG TPA: DinB family protein [Phycisphaerales bacterium]|nr:DinB family protein [Phycisphaerales bacterium]
MSQTMSIAIESLVTPLARVIDYMDLLAKDIPDRHFGHMPHPNMNHPAFCYGHLSIYPNRMLNMLDKSELKIEKAGWEDLFKAGVPCVEQDGRYPQKSEIVEYCIERHKAVREALTDVDEEIFTKVNPTEGKFRERFPHIGSALTFLTCAHTMVHLGQVSAWRRAMGLPSAM